MRDTPIELHRGEYTLSTDRTRLDLDAVHGFLRVSYWARGMTRDKLERAVENSICFGIYHGARQAAFARAITDLSTYAYLADVFVLEADRRHGLGKWMVEAIVAHPDLQGLRRMALFTRDARTLYERYGFAPASGASTYLERR